MVNIATTATSNSTDRTIVLQNNTTGTSFGSVNTGNITMNTGYNNLNITGGNSTSYLFGAYTALFDRIHLTYNNVFLNNSGTITIPNISGTTNRVTVSYGTISLCAENVNVAPTEYLRVDYFKNITAMNSAVFNELLVGNVSDNCSGSAGTFTGNLSGNVSGTMNTTVISAGVITNNMLASMIDDSKLNTIVIANKVLNNANALLFTTSNVAYNNTLVIRDGSAGISANYAYLTELTVESGTSSNVYISIDRTTIDSNYAVAGNLGEVVFDLVAGDIILRTLTTSQKYY